MTDNETVEKPEEQEQQIENNPEDQIEETQGDSHDDEQEEVVVSFGEDSPPQEDSTPTPDWVKEVRKENREKAKRIKELEAKIAEKKEAEAPQKLRDKPKLADHEYDDAVYESDLEKWYQEKAVYEKKSAEVEKQKQTELQKWQQKQEAYREKKSKVPFRDYDEVEDDVKSTLSDTQQAMLVKLADDPTTIVYALGKNSEKLKELSLINDHAEFIYKLAKLEGQLKVTTRKPKTAPEKLVKSSGGASFSVDKTLEKLEQEADKTGDRSQILAYKRKLKREKG